MDIKLELGEEVGGKRRLTIVGEGLLGVFEVDVAKIRGTKSLGYLIRQIGDGLILGRDGETVDPMQIRERRALAFGPRRRPKGRRT